MLCENDQIHRAKYSPSINSHSLAGADVSKLGLDPEDSAKTIER